MAPAGASAVFGPDPELLQASAQEPGHLHLADAHSLCDLALAAAGAEAKTEDLALAGRQTGEQRRDGQPVVHVGQPLVADTEPARERQVVARGDGRFERGVVAESPRVECLEDVLERLPDPTGYLDHRRRAAQLLGELVDRVLAPKVQVVDAARKPDRPAAVAKVALQLTENGRGRERGELVASVRVEAVDGFEQPDQRDLVEVVELLAPLGEARRQGVGQTLVGGDHVVAGAGVASLVVVLDGAANLGPSRSHWSCRRHLSPPHPDTPSYHPTGRRCHPQLYRRIPSVATLGRRRQPDAPAPGEA